MIIRVNQEKMERAKRICRLLQAARQRYNYLHPSMLVIGREEEPLPEAHQARRGKLEAIEDRLYHNPITRTVEFFVVGKGRYEETLEDERGAFVRWEGRAPELDGFKGEYEVEKEPLPELDYSKPFAPMCPVIDGKWVGKAWPISLHIELYAGWGENKAPDCRIGHFGHNFYVRTRAGMERRKYKSMRMLMREVENLLRRKYGVPILRWVNEADSRAYG